jgi:hypothetical protein
MSLFSQSFFVLSNVDSYDPIVINSSVKTQDYTNAIKEMMNGISKELGIVTKGHPSRVLAFLITDISLGESIGLEVKLELGEYLVRDKHIGKVFSITYQDSLLIAPNMKDKEDIEQKIIGNPLP